MKIIQSPSSGHMTVDGKSIINFGGSCYLGITEEKSLIDAAKNELDIVGAVGQIPRHYGYTTDCKERVISKAKDFFDTEAAMYFSSGYLFASIAIQGLKDDFDVIFIDENAHFSIKDAVKLVEKPVYSFKHCDSKDLDKQIKKYLKPGEVPCVAVDGMFPTYGNLSPIGEYYKIIKPFNGWMIIDESHSFGIIGETGKGTVEEFKVLRERVVAGGSMAKSFCAYGGVAVGTKYAIDKMNISSPALGAASGMSAAAAMTAASLEFVSKHPELLIKARSRISVLKEALNSIGLRVGYDQSPVATFEYKNAKEMKALQKYLEDNHIFVSYSTYVGAGPEGVIRIASYPDHNDEDIEKLITLLKEFINK